jgi:hypothetical protein
MAESKLLVKGTPPPRLERELAVIGRSLNRRDAAEKVTGQAKYAGDIRLDGMLYGKTLHCPYPRARIKRLDEQSRDASGRSRGSRGEHERLAHHLYRVENSHFPNVSRTRSEGCRSRSR